MAGNTITRILLIYFTQDNIFYTILDCKDWGIFHVCPCATRNSKAYWKGCKCNCYIYGCFKVLSLKIFLFSKRVRYVSKTRCLKIYFLNWQNWPLFFLVPGTLDLHNVQSEVCMAPVHVPSKACIAPFPVQSKVCKFALHMNAHEFSNAKTTMFSDADKKFTKPIGIFCSKSNKNVYEGPSPPKA